jgi:hypothetical protein
MRFSDSFSGVNEYAKSALDNYYAQLSKESDEQVKSAVESERNNHGWTSQRSYYLAALRQVCKERNLDYCW